MAPGGSKRKRSDQQPSQDATAARPSPHRPENLGLAQRGDARGGRGGGRGGGRRQSRQGSAMSPVDGANNTPLGSRNVSSPSPANQPPQRTHSKAISAAEESVPATPAHSTAPAVQPPQPQAQQNETNEPSAPVFYEHVTDEVLQQWQESGKEAVQTMANDADEIMAITLLDELVRSSLDGRLRTDEAASVVQQMIAHHREQDTLDVQDLFLNVVSVSNEADHDNPKLLALVSATNIDPDVIRRELDVPLLSKLPLVRGSFSKIRIRKTTNVLYRQANFNLLREESEGYAKLVTEYFNTANAAVDNQEVSAEAAFQRIMALVGSFDLDVGRVLDITLDISANILVRAYPFLIKFYRCSSWWPADSLFDDIRYEAPSVSSFPSWLQLANGKDLTDDELEQLKQEEKMRLHPTREARDVRFWRDVSDHGMQPFFEIGARKIINLEAALPILETPHRREYLPNGTEVNADRRARIDEDRKYMRTTGVLPPPGNADAAQLLGFKLRFYASAARDEKDKMPENLAFLAALLIKIGFISLRDLYPHLYPSDEDMAGEKQRLGKEKAEKEARERSGGGMNALTMAGALTDDTLPIVRNLRNEKERSGASTPKQDKKEDEARTELPTPNNQKILLLKALLAIGALPESLYILGRFPWLVDVDASLAPYLHRIANRMLSKVADFVTPLNDRSELQEPKQNLSDSATKPDGTLPLKAAMVPKSTRWFWLDQLDRENGRFYRHYYSDWDDNIPVCQSVDDVFLLCDTFLGYLGVKVGQDAELLGTLVRIAKHSLTKDFTAFNRSRWLDLMRRLLVPALSLSKHNPGLSQAVYELLKLFPTATRYSIYAEWYQGKTSRLPDMRVAFDHSKAEAKDVLRRVTNETGKKQARALAKVTLSSPGIVTMMMINQLENYSNMIPSLVECTRYFSFLAYDVLTWCLINSLGGHGRDRLQEDGMLTSPWLRALSQFAASLFLRYSIINPSPVLQFLASELRVGDTTDLELLEQILNEMAGIRSDIDFNDAQVLAMAGGDHLRAVTVQQLHDKRHLKKDKLARLFKALSDSGLTGPMLIAIAQERQLYAYHESSKFMPLKVLGSNLDKIQGIFMQYLEALKTSLKPEDFQAKIPDVVGLIGDFGIEPGIAFTICRTVVLQRIADFDVSKAQEAEGKKRSLSQQSTGDMEMKEDSVDVSKLSEVIEDGEVSDGNAGSPKPTGNRKRLPTPHATGAPIANGGARPWHPVLALLIRDISDVAPGLADRVSIPFFVTFWTLSLQDILVHPASYDNEIKRLRAQVSELTPSNRSNMSAIAIKEFDRKKKSLSELQEKLSDELKGRIGTYQKTRNRLSKSEKDHWFERSVNKIHIDARHVGLLQECFLPRATLSSLDAHYCFLMLKMLHDNGTPGFSTMILFSHLFKKQQLASIICQCTEVEAARFGRFLCEVLKLLQHWHSDKTAYEKEAFGSGKQERLLPGFAKRLDATGKPEAHLEYEDFRRLLFNWHTFLNGALLSCFESPEFMHVRNGIFVLQRVSQVFPTITFMGNNMIKQLTRISEEESRKDLRTNATSALGPLKQREKSWMMPQAFRLNDASKEAGRSGSRAPSAKPETPQPTSQGTAMLSATASEFQPTASGLTNGTSRKESVAGREDGEVEDEKPAVAHDEDVTMKDDAPVKDEAKQEQATSERPSSTVPEKEPTQSPSRAETPASVPSKPPPAETPRTRSAHPPPRPAHNLPDRPERTDMRPPNKPLPATSADRGQGRYGSRPDERFGRLDRPNDTRPLSRDHSPHPRTPERDAYYGPRGPPRDDRVHGRAPADGRYGRDDPYAASRREPLTPAAFPGRQPYESRGRVNGSMGPPPGQDRRSERETMPSSAAHSAPPANTRPPLSSQQAPVSETSTPHSENPERLAMITKNDSGPSSERDREVSKDARLERDVRDERSQSSRTITPVVPREQARAEQATEHAPNGPRRSRSTRDLGPSGPPENSYGRLNGPPEAPSGPARVLNGPSGRGGRMHAGQQPLTPTGRPSEPPIPAPSSSRPAESPRGPGARAPPLSDRRNSGSHFDRQPSSNSVPTTPATDNGPAVHPSRIARVSDQPSPVQTSVAAPGPQSAASTTTATPLGPRVGNAPSRAPTGPSAAAPPTGPTSSFERQRRQGGQLADINATLQGSQGQNGQGVNFRGAAQNRQAPPVSVAIAQPVHAIASSMEPPARRGEPGARREGRNEPRADLFESRQVPTSTPGGRGGSRMPAAGQEAHDEHHRGSHQPSRDRRPDEVPAQRPPPPGMEDRRLSGRDDRRGRDEPRDHREAARVARSEDRPPQRPPPQEAPATFAPPPPGWDRRGPPDERRNGRGSTRPEEFRGGRRDEERRLPLPPGPRDDGSVGRKRRHEEAPFEGDKRRRGGR